MEVDEESPTVDIVLPGDDITSKISSQMLRKGERFAIGPGLRREGERIKVVKFGVLKSRDKPMLFWIDSRQKRVS